MEKIINFDGFSIKVEADGLDWLVTTIPEINYGHVPTPVRVKPGGKLVVGQGDKRHEIINPSAKEKNELHTTLGHFCGGCDLNNRHHRRCVI